MVTKIARVALAPDKLFYPLDMRMITSIPKGSFLSLMLK